MLTVVPDKNCLVLSGHTHGGIAGIPGVFSLVTMVGVPDNGLWRKDSNIVYVNRGQGNRSLLGNMLTRLFITSEKSILTVKTQMDEIV